MKFSHNAADSKVYYRFLSWHYYHGDLNKIMQHDLVTAANEEKPTLGESKVQVIDPSGNTIEALCFSWISEDEMPRQMGLIVLENDESSVNYARECMKTNKNCI